MTTVPPSTHIAWSTDPHLDFLGEKGIVAFAESIAEMNPAGLIITGDIANAPTLEKSLLLLANVFARPIYLVLGNHDFYFGSFDEVNAAVAEICSRLPACHRLGTGEAFPLSARTGLVGCDGWGDGRAGLGMRSEVLLNDFLLIKDLTDLTVQERFSRLAQLGDASAGYLRSVLPRALKEFEQVIVATHVPPFPEASWHDGKMSDPEWLPHFTCVAAGNALREVVADFPSSEVVVLCGHTHGEGKAVIDERIEVHTGAAEYGRPRVNAVLDV